MMKAATYNHHKNSFSESNIINGSLKHFGSDPKHISFIPKKLIIPLILSLSVIYFLYIVSVFFSSPSCPSSSSKPILTTSISIYNSSISSSPPPPLTIPNSTLVPNPKPNPTTNLSHIVFGIAASAKLWDKRKEYIKTWYRPDRMRGFVWLDKPVKEYRSSRSTSSSSLPAIKISSNAAKFPYTHRQGHRSAIRISRIVTETFNLDLDDVHWFVMGDDDTIFVPENLVTVLSKFDHTHPYYIGSSSESHLQNIYFSYNMAYGGGGFAISKPLAAALSKMQDGCLHRYPNLYGSDDRIQACTAELGIPLTKHPGFHQYDVYGDLLGLLASHPVAPLVSLHHLDVVQPIFPGYSRANSIKKLFDGPIGLDAAGTMQQSICYEKEKRWTLSVSWGFVVEIVRGVMSPREMEMPARTFLNWYKRADYTAYAFNTRPVARNPCQRPFVYYMETARFDERTKMTAMEYRRRKEPHPAACKWKMADPSAVVDRIVVYKKPDPGLWDRSPRRNCCRVKPIPSKEARKKTMSIHVGVCREGEISH